MIMMSPLYLTASVQEGVRISQRVRAGLEVARRKGKRIGRPPRTQLSVETRTAIADCYAKEKTSLRTLAERFVRLPWNGKDIVSIVSQFKTILSQPPETWSNVQWNPQAQGLGPPPIAGRVWK
jgi:DNA invertase Pin-like site-specific DNA recombinase